MRRRKPSSRAVGVKVTHQYRSPLSLWTLLDLMFSWSFHNVPHRNFLYSFPIPLPGPWVSGRFSTFVRSLSAQINRVEDRPCVIEWVVLVISESTWSFFFPWRNFALGSCGGILGLQSFPPGRRRSRDNERATRSRPRPQDIKLMATNAPPACSHNYLSHVDLG